MTSVRSNSVPKSILQGLTLLALFWISSCRLEDNKLQATIYPENDATNVAVNTVIEIQYPKELGLQDDQMKSSLFSIHECEIHSFDYLMPKQKQNTTPATDPEKTETTASTEPTKNKSDEDQSANSETKFKSEVKFFHMHRQDSTQTIFNYLVINANDQETPLKPATTYCVKTNKIKNERGETIGPKEISFTTEETPSITFDTKINPEFFGKRLAPSIKDKSGQWHRDYVLVYFRNQAINPFQLKSQIKMCLSSEEMVSSSDACKDFGKEIAFDIFLVEGLQNEDRNMYAYYNLYAITPRVQLSPGQIKVAINLDVDKEAEANIGTHFEIIEIDSDPTPEWRNEYNNEIKGENSKPVASPNHRFFYVGSGS
jgi:hypothetical protein